MNLLRIQKIINKKSYENKIYVLRRYPLVFVRFIFFFILLAVLPYALYYVFDYMYPLLFSGPVAKPLLILCSSAYYLAIWVFFLSSFVDYYLDIWIVTNDRIINIEQLGLFARSISELDLYQIQDVTSEIKGIFPTFFNYGYVLIQTAGEVSHFNFEQVRDPHTIRKTILDLVDEDRKYHLKNIKGI